MQNHDPKSDRDNHANQCNPNNDEYWSSRGQDCDECEHDKLCDSDDD